MKEVFKMNKEKKVLIIGKSFYSNVSKKNNDGKYGVCISNPDYHINKGAEKQEVLKEVLYGFTKYNEEKNVYMIQIRNSKFPLRVYDKNNQPIDNAYIKNDTNIQVVCSYRWDESRGKFYLVVDGVKILDDYKNYHPFENDIDFGV